MGSVPDSASETIAATFVLPLDSHIKDIGAVLIQVEEASVLLSHLETRPNKESTDKFSLELFVQVTGTIEQVKRLAEALRKILPTLVIHQEIDVQANPPVHEDSGRQGGELLQVPWFPRHISELDIIANNVYVYGKDLDADYPSFKDEEYRKRRNIFAETASKYKHGTPIPRFEYTTTEKETWGYVYRELTKLYETHACRQYLDNLKLLQLFAGYGEQDLPQLEDVSKFLKSRTGFTIRPVGGYISARDFLSGLAFRVFFCTQYIRHSKNPMYTPEPDCCHELLGHVPMLADPAFAQFSHELGLASLGTTDAEVKKLATCYFFTIEFGLCRQDGQLRAYGAGLLSSSAELQHALSDSAEVRPFIPDKVMHEECLVTTFQNRYFETVSFEDATEQMRRFAKTIQRPFDIVYDPITESVRTVDSLDTVSSMLANLESDISTIRHSVDRLRRHVGDKKPICWIMDKPHIFGAK
ncbi:unnamed protein product [Dicrocoelium dendriticum]|nr:unnamed protein product [Dicrocoelium dendriticum]